MVYIPRKRGHGYTNTDGSSVTVLAPPVNADGTYDSVLSKFMLKIPRRKNMSRPSKTYSIMSEDNRSYKGFFKGRNSSNGVILRLLG